MTAQERTSIKASIIDKMISIPFPLIHIQLAEAIVQIASVDFPQAWPDLVSVLASKLTETDFQKNHAILRTLHLIFKRYRSEGRTDELYTEINLVMSQFAPVLLQLYQSTETLLAAAQSTEIVAQLVQTLTLCNKIFYSLSSQDLPAFFEDHMKEFMDAFKRHFSYTNPLLEATTGDEDEEGPLEKLRVTVAEIINLYAVKYEEDFPMLSEFVELSWIVLTTNVKGSPRYDRLAGSSMAFLASVAKQERHKQLFGSVLQLVCDKIILPNLIFRDSDLELFEDEPFEFIRRDQELLSSGVDDLSRRAAAILFTRSLMEFFESEVTTILGNYIQQYLEQYTSSPSSKWREKNVATQLFAAIAIKGSVQMYGATKINAMVDIKDFFNKHIVSDLQPTNEALHSILKMDAIKFVHEFRNQLEKENLVLVFPQLMHHVSSHNHVIHTYAAMAVERILAIKTSTGPMFNADDLKLVVQPLCQNLVHLIMGKKTAEKMSENDLLMKALMRVLLLAQGDLLKPIIQFLVDSLSELLFAVAKNPSNPRFNHYMFESIAAIIRFCGPFPDQMSVIESKLLPVFQEIIQADMLEFVPYLLQLYSALVEFRSTPGIPDYARDLLMVCLQPPLWNVHGNTPALLRFIQACLIKDASNLDLNTVLPPLLGIFQTLLGSRVNDLFGFALWNTVVQTIPANRLSQYLQPALTVLLKKLQAQKISKIATSLLLSLSNMILIMDASTVFNLFESLQPKMIVGLFKSVLLSEASRLRDPTDRKATLLALVCLLVECPALISRIQSDTDYSSLWVAILGGSLSVIANIQQATSSELHTFEELPEVKDEDLMSTGSAFARLHVIPSVPKFTQIKFDPVALLLSGLVQLSKSMPAGALGSLCGSLDQTQRSILQSLLQQSNVTL